MKRISFGLRFLFFTALLLKTSFAMSFTLIRNGNGQTASGWAGNTVTFDIDASCSSYSSYVNAAMSTAADVWGKVPNSALTVNIGSTTNLPQAITHYVGNSADSYAPNGNAIVYCDSSFAAHSGEDANSIPGFATGQNLSGDGTILGCLLVLNVQGGAAASITTLSSTEVNTVLTHEIGHCLGLGHSSDQNALMYYATGAGRGTYLAQDDIDGITYLYPKQDLSGTGFKGCSALAANEPPRVFHDGLWAGLFRTFGADLFFILMVLALFLGRRWIRR